MVHTTSELEQMLGESIAARSPMHAWPLSSVESLTTASGRRFVYKVQREPTVEPEFLSRVRSKILPDCRVLQRDRDQAAVLLPLIQAPTLRDKALDEKTLLTHGRALVQEIGEIAGDVPLYIDIGTPAAWRDFAGNTLEMLSGLMRAGVFDRISSEDLAFLSGWAQAREVIDSIETSSQLINGDLKAEHVFCTGQGAQIIDWQRPYRAPGDIDLVILLESLGLPAQPHVTPAVFGLRWFLHVHWAVEAKTHLLPALPFYDEWARTGIDWIISAGVK